jgi:hypothetical protein
MPILVIAVVAFIIFLTLMALVISAVVSEQRKAKQERIVISDFAALEAAPPKQNSTFKPA